MTEEQFKQEVNKGINQKYHDNWGVICATFSPFDVKEIHSTIKEEGFFIWVVDRKHGRKSYGEEKQFSERKDNYAQDVINFINDFEIKMKEYE